jgi:hypothetical protein
LRLLRHPEEAANISDESTMDPSPDEVTARRLLITSWRPSQDIIYYTHSIH